jgi:hypothetical protein
VLTQALMIEIKRKEEKNVFVNLYAKPGSLITPSCEVQSDQQYIISAMIVWLECYYITKIIRHCL